MTHSLLSLVVVTLLLCGGVAAVPQLVRDVQPRSSPEPLNAPLQELWIVQASDDRWFLAGSQISRAELGRRLQRAGADAQVQFLPSAALPLGEVSASLAWLRRQGKTPVLLALPPRP